jgi:hypothetical protein
LFNIKKDKEEETDVDMIRKKGSRLLQITVVRNEIVPHGK